MTRIETQSIESESNRIQTGIGNFNPHPLTATENRTVKQSINRTIE